MIQITPCRTLISDRFPVASVVVRVPGDACFEIASATDPRLFHPEWQHRRTPRNFYTSRGDGLMRAPAGEATYILPPHALEAFAGASRLHFALGVYGGPRMDDGRFSIHPDRLDQVPFLKLANDFTGRTLSRPGVPAASRPRYGGRPPLTWGGDLAVAAAMRAVARRGVEYDDGFDPVLWQSAAAADDEGSEEPEVEHVFGHDDDPAPMPEEEPEHEEAYGGRVAYGRRGRTETDDEPDGYEDAAALRAAGHLDHALGETLSIAGASGEAFGGAYDSDEGGFAAFHDSLAGAPAEDDDRGSDARARELR
jgi:hypothetical protein